MTWQIFLRKGLLLIVSSSIFLLLSFQHASQKPEKSIIHLKWHPVPRMMQAENHLASLKWCLAYIGAPIPQDTSLTGIAVQDSIIIVNPHELGLSKKAADYLSYLHKKWKKTPAYKASHAFDLGRYISLIIGNSDIYYRLADVPKKLKKQKDQYKFEPLKGFIDNSSVSFVDRIISFSQHHASQQPFFLSAEQDSATGEVMEIESLDIMPNGMPRFGIYSLKGKRKEAASASVTRAGKPAKCMWCHESSIAPLFRKQQEHEGYLSYQQLKGRFQKEHDQLDQFQKQTWQDRHFVNPELHTKMELAYISFMEPTAERVAREWGVSLAEVQQRLAHLKTHRHHEFDFLGDLYHRDEIDPLAPLRVAKSPESIREASR